MALLFFHNFNAVTVTSSDQLDLSLSLSFYCSSLVSGHETIALMIMIGWGRVTCHGKPIRGRVGRNVYTHSKACIRHTKAQASERETGMANPNDPNIASLNWSSHYFSLQEMKGTSELHINCTHVKCTLCPGQSASPRLCQVIQTSFNVACFVACFPCMNMHVHVFFVF